MSDDNLENYVYKLEERIAELEELCGMKRKQVERIDVLEKSLKRLWDHKHPIMIHEIAELKEEMKIFKGAIINYNHDYDRIRQVREVLRELLSDGFHDSFSDKLLAKLSGEDNKTEKKESDFTDEAMDNIMNYIYKRDSGGEKTVVLNGTDSFKSYGADNSTDSKPPEPLRKGGCYQWTYCSECMLIDDCPNPNNKEMPKYWKFKEDKLK